MFLVLPDCFAASNAASNTTRRAGREYALIEVFVILGWLWRQA
jgi:hypothetical protein